MTRFTLTDFIWVRLSQAISETGCYSTDNLRLQLEGIIHRIRCGPPWRDLPKEFGPWQAIYQRFRRWSKNGTWTLISEILEDDPDLSSAYVDSTYIKVYQHAAGAPKGQESLIGKSKGGSNTKLHIAVDKNQNPLSTMITAGNYRDCPVGEDIMIELDGVIGEFIADKAYDSDHLRDLIESCDARAVIPRKSSSNKPKRGFHKSKYRKRHVVENFFAK